jgi:uncharacterized protein
VAREIRLDRGKLSKAKRTPQGYVRVDGRLTRVGILEYQRADGSIQRELRPESEVFKTDSLASLDGCPVTDLHPSVMLDVTNTQALARGHVRAVKRDGHFVSAELTVQTAELINKIDAGERAEISCGYACEYDPTPGVWQGQRYDGVQRNIEYNHVAIGPRAWGRAGAEVALRLDAADAPTPVLVSRFDDSEVSPDNSGETPARISHKDSRTMLKINGVEIKLDAAEAKLVQDELDARAARADAAEKKCEQLQASAGASSVELSALKTRCDAAEAQVAQVKRTELEAQVRPVLGSEFKCDGKSDVELKSAVVAKMLPELRLDSADATFVHGAFGAAMTLHAKAAGEMKQAAKEAAPGTRTDSEKNDPDKARAEMIERRRAAASVK